MKNYKDIFLVVIFLLLTASCTTVEKVKIFGNPGEKIYSPSKQHIATIQQNGNVKIKLSSDAYYGYLYTYEPTFEQWVPFALDITNKSHNGTKFAVGIGTTLSTLGVGATLGGLIPLIADQENIVGPMISGAGGATALIGLACMTPAYYRLVQLSYQYNFGYNSRQQVNSDLRLTRYVPPIVETPDITPNRKKATSGEASIATDGSSAKPRKNNTASTAKKKRKTSSELIAGEYAGSGTLITHGEDPETLGAIQIIITPKGDDIVLAEIMEDNEAFFESEELFKVQKNKNGSFTLTHTRIPSVKFTLSKEGKIDYKHPKVNIDGTTYILSISANRRTK